MRNEVKGLYGDNVNPLEWSTMQYQDVLQLKVKMAKNQLKIISDVHYTKMDMAGMNNCLRAIKFNEELLKELE